MTTNDIPKFHCPHLESAVRTSLQLLNGFQKEFDAISEDIKSLEAYLRTRNIVRSVAVEISRVGFKKNESGELTAIEHFSPYPITVVIDLEGKVGRLITETLLWTDEDPVGNRGRFRLYIETASTNGTFAYLPGGRLGINETEARSSNRVPLIESPIETRVRIKPYLPMLVTNLAKQLNAFTRIYTFEECKQLDDRSIQILLPEICRDDLVLALKGADEEMHDLVFRNMSQRLQDMIKEDLEKLDRAPQSEIARAQNLFGLFMQRLILEGRIAPL